MAQLDFLCICWTFSAYCLQLCFLPIAQSDFVAELSLF